MKPAIIGMMALTLITGIYVIGNAEELTQTIYGEGNINIGQIANGSSRQEYQGFQHKWIQSGAMVLGDSVTSGNRMTMHIELVGLVRNAQFIDDGSAPGNYDSRVANYAFYINRASGIYVFGDPETKPLSLTLGMFPYKYNPDVKNLGEYLFRSMTYPNYVNTWFDQPFARMLGFKLSSLLLGGSLRQDLILSSEWNQYPTKDFSLAYLAALNIGGFFDVGVGGQAFHLLSVRGDYTSPDSVRSKNRIESWYYASREDSVADKKSYYTFKGIKLMGRISIHPLAAAPEITLPVIGTLFGKNDLNLYAEANVLGLKNYPVYYAGTSSEPKKYEYYNKLSERIPVTFGINAPTNPVFAYGIIPLATFLLGKDDFMFSKQEMQIGWQWNPDSGKDVFGPMTVRVKDFNKRLMWSAGSVATTAAALFLQNKLGVNVRPDVLAFECEYWPNRYANGWTNVYSSFIPVPDWDPGLATFVHNRWRWSVYTAKRVGNFFVKFQLAHDHLAAFQPQLGELGTVDNLGAAGYWWWTLKTGYSF